MVTPGSRSAGVFVVSGPTAVGKGTVVARLKELHPELFVSISATTRAPRPQEMDGVHYHFVTEDDFDHLIAEDGLLEWACVHGSNRYGTPRRPVEEALARGQIVILEIDLQGAEQVRRTLPQAVEIFLSPPSWQCLVQRLSGRGTETPEQMQRRLETARHEMAHAQDFDHVVVNDRIEDAVAKLVSLLGL